VRLFLLASVLRGFALLGLHAVLFNLYLLRLGYGPEFVGLVSAAGSFALAGFSPLAGALSTRWGGRRVLILSVALILVGSGLLPCSDLVPDALQTAWLVACSVLMQSGRAAYFVSSLPFLMSVTAERERGFAFSSQVALEPLAAFGGSLLGGALPALCASWFGLSLQAPDAYRLSLALTPFLQLPAIAALLATSDRRARSPAKASGVAGAPPWVPIAVMTVVVMLRTSALGAVGTFFNVYLDDELSVSTAGIGVLSGVAQLLSVPAALLAPPLVARYGRVSGITLGSLCITASMLPLACIPHWSAAGLGFAGATACFAMTTGPIRVHSQEIVAPQWRGTMAGAVLTGVGLTYAAMALAGAYSITALGYRGVFLAGAALTAAGALLFWAVFRMPRA
jgi:MFS family permease